MGYVYGLNMASGRAEGHSIRQERKPVPAGAVRIVAAVRFFDFQAGIHAPSPKTPRGHELNVRAVEDSSVMFGPVALPEEVRKRLKIQHIGHAYDDPSADSDASGKAPQRLPGGGQVFQHVCQNQAVEGVARKRLPVIDVDDARGRKPAAGNCYGTLRYVHSMHDPAAFDEYGLCCRRPAAD
jgi:hypothetical protein